MNFAQELGNQIRARLPEVKNVQLPDTQGGADNLYHLEDPQVNDPQAARCAIALTKLNVAVDATYGVYQFNSAITLHPEQGPPARSTQNQILGLRTVGPAFDDLLQIVVRDPQITKLEQLCGKPLSIGLPLSGSRQLTAVFYRAICGTELDDGQGKIHPQKLDEGFDLLNSGAVDAVIWVNATPTEAIQKEIMNHQAHLLNINIPSYVIDGDKVNVLEKMNGNWRSFYRSEAGGEYIEQDVILSRTIFAEDYDATQGDIMTVGVPNGVVVRDSTDPALVAALANILLSKNSRMALTKALWPDDPRHSHQLADVRNYVDDLVSSLFCYVPLHPAAAAVYRSQFNLPLPHCGKT